MKFRPKNYKENLTKLMELSYRLNSMIKDGSFYELSFLDRYREVRNVKHLYNKLRGPVSEKGLEQAVSFAAVLMLITGARCSDTTGSGYANVTIDLGLRDKNKAVASMTKAPAPQDVTEISLTVTGPGMNDINESIPVKDGAISLMVPAGDDRVFSVRAETEALDYYTGSATEDLKAGENTDVHIIMAFKNLFVKRAPNPFGIENTGSTGQFPSFVDIDDDGDLDLFITKYGPNNGETEFFKNLTVESSGTPSFDAPVTNPYSLSINTLFKTFVDIDGDGDLDVYGQGSDSGFYGYLNYGSNSFGPRTPAIPDTFTWQNVGPSYPNFNVSVLSFVDIDADGDPDLFVAGLNPTDDSITVEYLENTDESSVFGDPVRNAFGISSIPTTQLVGIYDFLTVSPAFVDIDGDGDFDLFTGVGWRDNPGSAYYFNDFFYFENTGTTDSPSFAAPVNNPFGITGTADGTYSANAAMVFPAFADIDGDGDQDLFIGDGYGNIQYFENQSLGTPDVTPPANVEPPMGNQVGNNVELTWTDPADWDFTKVSITFTPAEGGVAQPIEIQKGIQSASIGPLSYDVSYTFTVRSVDDMGNQSTGASVSVEILSK